MRSCFKINKTYCQHSNFARRGAIKATARPWLKWMFSQVCAPGAKHQRAMEHFDYIVVGAGKCLMSNVPPKNLLKICNKFWHIFRDWGFLDCLSANQRANQAVCANFGKISLTPEAALTGKRELSGMRTLRAITRLLCPLLFWNGKN